MKSTLLWQKLIASFSHGSDDKRWRLYRIRIRLVPSAYLETYGACAYCDADLVDVNGYAQIETVQFTPLHIVQGVELALQFIIAYRSGSPVASHFKENLFGCPVFDM
ncbi:hypothetical protein Tsp_10962 [Trichinella spiralis]|uniref:hypothetical protein n=1 Tax=Trichinella spiralis TaxID=6334 RepID=UPI0001EFBE10|nr:hypothetical protein Tsp_10962 [Trichinella spiralis]